MSFIGKESFAFWAAYDLDLGKYGYIIEGARGTFGNSANVAVYSSKTTWDGDQLDAIVGCGKVDREFYALHKGLADDLLQNLRWCLNGSPHNGIPSTPVVAFGGLLTIVDDFDYPVQQWASHPDSDIFTMQQGNAYYTDDGKDLMGFTSKRCSHLIHKVCVPVHIYIFAP